MAYIIELFRRSRLVQYWAPVFTWMAGIFYFSSRPDPLGFLPSSGHGIDIERLAHIGEYAGRAACYHALRFTQTLFSTPIPDGIMAVLRPDLLRCWLVSRFVTPEKRLLGDDLTISVPQGFLLNLLMVDRWRDLARVCLTMLWPDAQWLTRRHRMARAGRLHPRLWHLARVLRYVLALLKRSQPGRA